MVTADNRSGLPSKSGRQHDVVIRVATSGRFTWDGRDERERCLEQPNRRSHIRRALTKRSRQHISKLVQQWSRRNHDVVPDAVLQKIGAGPPRHKSGDQHVRIQKQSHETRVNTSSSVKMP